MPTNSGFQREEGRDQGNSTSHHIDIPSVQNDATSVNDAPLVTSDDDPLDSRSCYDKAIDWLGPRQSGYIKKLRPLRTHLIMMQETLKIYQAELDRELQSKSTSRDTAARVQKCVREINALTTGPNLNIAPQEDEMLRRVAYDLAVVGRLIEEVINTAPEEKSRTNSLQLTPTQHLDVRMVLAKQSEPAGDEDKKDAKQEDESTEPKGKVDLKSLRDKITAVSNLTETFINYIDVKLEHRWWLRDLIYFLQISIKICLLLFSTLSVVYHNDKVFSIITLTISASQGIVEILDQVFLKKVNPEDVHITSVTSMTKAGNSIA